MPYEPPPDLGNLSLTQIAALVAERAAIPARHYLGASRIGEPCPRRVCYELMQIAVDDGADFSGRMLRIFEAGHRFEDMTIRWLRLAGFDLRTHNRGGEQFGFSVAGGRFRLARTVQACSTADYSDKRQLQLGVRNS